MQAGRMTFTLVMAALAAAPVACGGAPAPDAEAPSPESAPAPDASDEPTASGADDAAEVCGEAARRAAECNVKLIPPEAKPDVEDAKSQMRDMYVKQCTERTAEKPERLTSARECLKQADDCALVDCLGDTIGQ